MSRMADITRRKSGVYELRRRVPFHLQAVLGKKELRQSLGTKDLGEAKRVRLQKDAEIERLFANAGLQVTLTHRDIVSLAAHWLAQKVAAAESTPPDETTIDASLDFLHRADEDKRSADVMAADVESLLSAEDLLNVSGASRAALAERLFWQSVEFWNTMTRRNQGDYSADTALAKAPAWRGPDSAAVAPTVSLESLWDLWVKEKKRPEKTVYAGEKRWAKLCKFIGHTDAAKVTADDAWRWVESLQACELDPSTINNGYLGGVHAVFGLAVKRRKLKDNPFAGVSVDTSKREKARTKRQPFDDDEARVFLLAARAHAKRGEGWLRWVTFTMAYTGCRLEEITGARACDVREEAGFSILDITLNGEGRSLKNESSVRKVPLHPALVAEGLVDYARGLKDQSGPLFPDLGQDQFGVRAGIATKHLARLLRKELKILDPRKVAAHSWRHRFVQLCRANSVPTDARKAMTGHVPGDEGDKYGGDYPLHKLAEFVALLPTQT